MARLNLTRPRTLGIGLAVVSLAFAACSKSSTNSPIPTGSPTPTAIPTPVGSPNSLSSPCAANFGIAYEPDGGNAGAFRGIQVTRFENGAQNLCTTAAANVTPPTVAFASAVGPLAFASDRSVAVAILANPSGAFTLAQDIFGAQTGALVPVGSPYDLGAFPPTPAPTASASPSASPTPPNAPLFSDTQSVAILTSTSFGTVAVAGGTAAAGSPNALVALTSLNFAPPQYGGAVPFAGASYTLKSIPANPRSIVRIGSDANGAVALVRGPQDLLAFAITAVGTGYQFDATAIDSTLGSNVVLRGSGQIAFDPSDASRALVGGTTAGGDSTLTLVTGLPTKITQASTLAMPGAIRSIVVASNGLSAIVGTSVGIVVVSGVGTGQLAVVPAFAPNGSAPLASAPSYRTCTGATATLSSIDSVAFSADQKYLVALGETPGVTCPSTYNASIVALPFNTTTGAQPTPSPAPSASASATPAPTMFVQNNVIAPPTGADYLVAY